MGHYEGAYEATEREARLARDRLQRRSIQKVLKPLYEANNELRGMGHNVDEAKTFLLTTILWLEFVCPGEEETIERE